MQVHILTEPIADMISLICVLPQDKSTLSIIAQSKITAITGEIDFTGRANFSFVFLIISSKILIGESLGISLKSPFFIPMLFNILSASFGSCSTNLSAPLK